MSPLDASGPPQNSASPIMRGFAFSSNVFFASCDDLQRSQSPSQPLFARPIPEQLCLFRWHDKSVVIRKRGWRFGKIAAAAAPFLTKWVSLGYNNNVSRPRASKAATTLGIEKHDFFVVPHCAPFLPRCLQHRQPTLFVVCAPQYWLAGWLAAAGWLLLL